MRFAIRVLVRCRCSRIATRCRCRDGRSRRLLPLSLPRTTGWDKAENTGDVAYVDNLLLPDYRSVSADGSVHNKSDILANAKSNIGSPDHAAKVAKWQAAHPMDTAAVIQGDTAIVTFHLKPLGPEKGIMSSDIFVYRDGEWHAIYSQHTDAGK